MADHLVPTWTVIPSDGADQPARPTAPTAKWPHVLTRRRWTIAAIGVALLLGVEGVWLVPYVGRAGHALAHTEPVWVLAAVAAETASMLSFAGLQRLIPRAGGVRVRLRDAAATVLAGNALSVTLPGGSMISLAYTTRRMRFWGVRPSLAGFSLVASAALNTIGLTVLAAAGASTAGNPNRPGGGVAEIAAGGVLITALLALVRRPRLIRRPALALLAVWARIRPADADRARTLLDSVLTELTAIRPRTRVWARGLTLAVLNWAADLLCLLSAARALGIAAPLGPLLLAYAAGKTAASVIPLLPGGLGPLDAGLVLALTHAGAPVASAGAAVLIYRGISLALVAATGWTILATEHRRRAPRATSSPAPTRTPTHPHRRRPRRRSRLGRIRRGGCTPPATPASLPCRRRPPVHPISPAPPRRTQAHLSATTEQGTAT